MIQTLAIARREFLAFFTTAVGYVVLALFLFTSGFFFMLGFQPGAEATMRQFFDWAFFIALVLAPAISMRLLSEELRVGTLETLMTAPVSETQVVVGKWAGAVGFFAAMLAPTLLYVLILRVYASPDWGAIVAGYLGILLVGMLYLALGTLTSALWPSQVLAYLLAIFFWLIFLAATGWLPQFLKEPWAEMLFWMSINRRYSNDFAKGVVDLSTIIYFASGVLLFLVTAVKVLESRRWR